jgi:hypothetical protein
MNKLKIFLTLLSITIIVVPIAFEVILYRDNLMGLIVPPEITNIANGNNNSNNDNSSKSPISNNSNISNLVNSGFELPQQVGEPQYNPETKTLTITFNYTNTLQTPIAVDKLEATIVSHDDGAFLGNVSLDKPLNFQPGQTLNITAHDVLSDEAINYFITNFNNQNSPNIDLVNLNVIVGGITVKVDRQNIGDITIPPEYLQNIGDIPIPSQFLK